MHAQSACEIEKLERMKNRICICCGQWISKEPKARIENPNLCDFCSEMPEGFLHPEDEGNLRAADFLDSVGELEGF